MLTGNEETAQIYAYIFSNQTKQVYRELVKFRRRAAYFEYIVQLLQKAFTEEMTVQEINEFENYLQLTPYISRREGPRLKISAPFNLSHQNT